MLIYILDYPDNLLELFYDILKLSVQHPSVCYDDDRIKYTLVPSIMENGELVCQPGYGIALA